MVRSPLQPAGKEDTYAGQSIRLSVKCFKPYAETLQLPDRDRSYGGPGYGSRMPAVFRSVSCAIVPYV